MRSDLEGLKITNRELKRLTGIPVKELTLPKTHRLLIISSVSIVLFFLSAIIIIIFPINPIISLGILILLISVFSKNEFYSLRQTISKAFSFKKCSKHLLNILKEVERYNAIIKAIDIKDQLEDAGNRDMNLSNRKQVIEALKITRSDLVRGLKTERILRENQDLIESYPEMFSSNLIALTALQVSDEASEHGRLLDEALQIALNVQKEMRNLESDR